MSTIQESDGAGHSVTLNTMDGHRFSTFGRSPEVTAAMFKELPNFQCREDDVFICAPFKSGTHWVWEIVSMLFTGVAESIQKSKVENMIEARPFEQMDALPSPRVLNSHMPYKLLPKEAKEKKCKIVLVLRNPKDVSVSLYCHVKGLHMYNYDGKWEHFLPLFLDGKLQYNSWFENVLEWEQLISENPQRPVHLVYYEDLKENNLEEIERLGKFIGIENKDELFEAVSEKVQFKNMRENKVIPDETRKRVFKDNYTVYRKGDIGDRKNWFTVAQNEHFDDVYNEKMKLSKLRFRYTNRLDGN